VAAIVGERTLPEYDALGKATQNAANKRQKGSKNQPKN